MSSLRQSLSQATTMSEIASVSSTSDARSRNANQKFIKEAVRKELIGRFVLILNFFEFFSV